MQNAFEGFSCNILENMRHTVAPGCVTHTLVIVAVRRQSHKCNLTRVSIDWIQLPLLNRTSLRWVPALPTRGGLGGS
jgi:hypothetical protein